MIGNHIRLMPNLLKSDAHTLPWFQNNYEAGFNEISSQPDRYSATKLSQNNLTRSCAAGSTSGSPSSRSRSTTTSRTHTDTQIWPRGRPGNLIPRHRSSYTRAGLVPPARSDPHIQRPRRNTAIARPGLLPTTAGISDATICIRHAKAKVADSVDSTTRRMNRFHRSLIKSNSFVGTARDHPQESREQNASHMDHVDNGKLFILCHRPHRIRIGWPAGRPL